MLCEILQNFTRNSSKIQITFTVEEEEMTAIDCSEQEFNFKEFLAK